jgi:CheY-like chemotaxis protein
MKNLKTQGAADTSPKQIDQIATVMVVDDDDNWCFLSRRMLQKAGVGKQILTANNGLEAIKKLQALLANGDKLPDLIFLDIKMPVMDGFEFLDEVTQWEALSPIHTRIFLCSSSVHHKDKERAGRYPVAGFITKPLTLEILKSILTPEN